MSSQIYLYNYFNNIINIININVKRHVACYYLLLLYNQFLFLFHHDRVLKSKEKQKQKRIENINYLHKLQISKFLKRSR